MRAIALRGRIAVGKPLLTAMVNHKERGVAIVRVEMAPP